MGLPVQISVSQSRYYQSVADGVPTLFDHYRQ